MHKTDRQIDVLLGVANDGHAELLEANLRDAGLVKRLIRVRDGAETLASMHSKCGGHIGKPAIPLLVLIDCRLAPAGGIDVLATIKKNRRYCWIPVIMLTEASEPHERQVCQALGCEAYITKWAALLGLQGFTELVRKLAFRADCIASCRWDVPETHTDSVGTMDASAILHPTRVRQPFKIRDGKEVFDEPPKA